MPRVCQLGGRNIVSSPEFQRTARELRAGTPALRYRALREYRDAFPDLVVINRIDEFPDLTAAIEKNIPADVRAGTRPASLVRNLPATAWCMAAPGKTYLVYTMNGAPVVLDLARERGEFSLAWLDAGTGELHSTPTRVTAGRVVTLAPPTMETNRPWVAWLKR